MARRRADRDPSGAGTDAAAAALHRRAGDLAGRCLQRSSDRLPWYAAMPPDLRSWVGYILQSAITSFASWYRDPRHHKIISAEVFGSAPPELTRAISFEQVVQLARVAIDAVEESLEDVVGPHDAPRVREAMLRYSREIAFAAATVYARAAEERGAWDARLEALVVDAVLRDEVDEAAGSQAAALRWPRAGGIAVVVGAMPELTDAEAAVDGVRAAARTARHQALVGVIGDRLVVLLDQVDSPVEAARCVVEQFGDGPVVVGPLAGSLVTAGAAARSAVMGLQAAPGWPEAPRPVAAAALLPERVLRGEHHARAVLLTDVFRPVAEDRSPLLETVDAYLAAGCSVEGAARRLLVHPNTVRYRLRRVHEVTGWSVTEPRGQYVLRLALTVGRLDGPAGEPASDPRVVVDLRQRRAD